MEEGCVIYRILRAFETIREEVSRVLEEVVAVLTFGDVLEEEFPRVCWARLDSGVRGAVDDEARRTCSLGIVVAALKLAADDWRWRIGIVEILEVVGLVSPALCFYLCFGATLSFSWLRSYIAVVVNSQCPMRAIL